MVPGGKTDPHRPTRLRSYLNCVGPARAELPRANLDSLDKQARFLYDSNVCFIQTIVLMPDPSARTQIADTKSALLDAAEHLFAERGAASASLRAITAAAEANLASVNYHFGSKQGLIRAVLARRLEPLNRRRFQLLDRCSSSGERAAELRDILHAFVEPAITMMHSQVPGDREFVQFLGRALADPADELRSLIIDEFKEVIERFTQALAQALPTIPRQEIAWRFHFMVGAMAHTVAAGYLVENRLEQLGLKDPQDPEQVTRRLVSFLESGWRSSSSQPESNEEIQP